ncbi:uncharacterized protein LOC117113183 isoform X2 [Anneissia japonica]|uniref:uncharacterized protein LOC117113183 isoform X2 n=1 Tax=Anneissia japonica TaxID=1529436 RepID=UPI001425A882|nr:uncharacterized protein LOC117113183 isoform X2 [Anneissia japonica]
MTATSILTMVTFTAVILSQISKCMLSANDCNANSVKAKCKKLTIFEISEDYSREDEPFCNLTIPVWAQDIFDYFNNRTGKKNRTDKECKEDKECLKVATKQLLRMLMYSLNDLPCSNQNGLDSTKFSTDVINAFHTFPPPTHPTYIDLACSLNEKWKIDTLEQALYIMDCILRPSMLHEFNICDIV